MTAKKTLTLALALAALGATCAESFARPVYRMRIVDSESGKELFDDGKLDGKICAVGKKGVYNPKTGKFSVIPAAKCNF